MPLAHIILTFALEAPFRGMLKMLTFMLASPPMLVRLPCLCRCFPPMCYTLVLSLLHFEIDFKLSLVSFWGCFRPILCALICFIKSFEPFKTRSCMFFIYPLIELFKIWWISQHGSFSSFCHIVVYIIFEEVILVNERFLFTLEGLWWVINILFKRNPLMLHVLPILTIHWIIFQLVIFVNV